MDSSVAQLRRQQRIDDLCAATIRALSGVPDVRFQGQRLYRGSEPDLATAPHLRPSPEDDFGSFRGAADGLALRLRHSDPYLHRQRMPTGQVAELVFEMLEQFRVESLARNLPGIVHNLRHRHESWSAAFHDSGLTETESGMLLYTVAQICRARVTGEPVVEATEDLLEGTRFSIAPLIGTDLVGLRRNRTDQAAYAVHARSLACTIAALVEIADDGSPAGAATLRTARNAFTLALETSLEETQVALADSGHSRVLADSEQGYRAFTRAYDREHRASALIRPAQARDYRERLDSCISDSGVNITHLARELRSVLTEPIHDGWDGGQEEGVIDGRSLAQLVTSPVERRVFRAERTELAADCMVTFLVDCSGSMRRFNESTALIVDIFARALDMAGVSSEVLGFSTGAWNGGRALRDWKRAGRSRHPGRLNELTHVVFKDAGTSWRRARPDIAGLLRGDLYREGVDGEAVGWACERMRARDEKRRILIVLSDGSPTDSATNLANDAHYLDHHLKEVVVREGSSVRICGLGVGLDLRPYYTHSVAVDLDEPLTYSVFREITALIAGRG